MANKIVSGRIVMKHDTANNWSKAKNFTPMRGEVILYDVDNDNSAVRVKLGDGVTNVNSLPFLGESMALSNNEIDSLF